MGGDGAFSHKYFCNEILNLEEHPNCIFGAKVMMILLNGWIFPIGGTSVAKGLRLQPVQQACYFREGTCNCPGP